MLHDVNLTYRKKEDKEAENTQIVRDVDIETDEALRALVEQNDSEDAYDICEIYAPKTGFGQRFLKQKGSWLTVQEFTVRCLTEGWKK